MRNGQKASPRQENAHRGTKIFGRGFGKPKTNAIFAPLVLTGWAQILLG
jgi:hypothetical protein